MKILQICSKPPFPQKDGYSLGINHKGMQSIFKKNSIKVIAINTLKHTSENIPSKYQKQTNYESFFIDTSVKLFPAFLNLFSNDSYNIVRFYNQNLADKIKSILKANPFDIILFEGLYVCPYFDIVSKNSNAKIILRAHNIESNIWKGIIIQTKNWVKKIYLSILYRRLLTYEKMMISKFDGIICVSQDDSDWIKKETTKPITYIPFCPEIKENLSLITAKKNSIFHIGSMDWNPNIDGINWFINKVWPIVYKKNKNIKLHLAGKNMSNSFQMIDKKNIITEGEVDNANDFMRSYNLMIVPLWSGSGIRIKILEAMALGKTIISTSIGASGINYSDKKNIFIADTPEEFANQIIWCFENPVESKKIGENAKDNILENYNTKKIAENLSFFLNKIQTL